MTRMQYLAMQAPDASPSQRYRVEAFLPRFRARGIDTRYDWALAHAELPIFYGKQPMLAKARIAARAMTRRARSLAHLKPADVVLVQREAFFVGPAWSEWVSRRRAPLVYDFDDAIWMKAVSEGNRSLSFLKNTAKMGDIVRQAHTVVAGNAYLADWARQFNSAVHIVPTVVDTDRYVPRSTPRPDTGPVVIGWSGSATTVAHFRAAIPALAEVKQRYGARVVFKLVGDPKFRSDELELQGEQWRSSEEVAQLQAMDVALMPLPDDDWSKGKCALKAIAAMSCGVPVVVSRVGVNPHVVHDGVHGFVATTHDEWVARLSQLIDDVELRRRLGANARARAVNDFSLRRWADPLADLILTAAASGWS